MDLGQLCQPRLARDDDPMTLGRCSLCSGTVSTPDVWLGVTPPRATCEGCGAVACEGEAVIEMVRREPAKFVLDDGREFDVKVVGGGER